MLDPLPKFPEPSYIGGGIDASTETLVVVFDP
jgi:hypothetical protein